jgi:hypothetical protein
LRDAPDNEARYLRAGNVSGKGTKIRSQGKPGGEET